MNHPSHFTFQTITQHTLGASRACAKLFSSDMKGKGCQFQTQTPQMARSLTVSARISSVHLVPNIAVYGESFITSLILQDKSLR